jgi:hypothetical protein
MSVKVTCYRCKSDVTLSDALYEAAKHSPDISFWCPYGHEQHFVAGETDEQRLRRERDNLKQQMARVEDEKNAALREAATERAARAEAERKAKAIKRRAEAALCPCCNRSFSQLARHMKSKHPDVVPMPTKKSA